MFIHPSIHPWACMAAGEKTQERSAVHPKTNIQPTKHTQKALKFELAARPSLGGIGVLGLDAALPKVAAFAQSLRQLPPSAPESCGCACHGGTGGRRRLYMAAVDVERCYDHIRPHALLELLRGMFCVACGLCSGAVRLVEKRPRSLKTATCACVSIPFFGLSRGTTTLLHALFQQGPSPTTATTSGAAP